MAAPSDQTTLNLMIRGFQVSRMLRLVADLAIADRLTPDTRSSVIDLALASEVQAIPLLRVLRALAAFGVFSVDVDGQVAHTPLSLLLRADAPNSLRPAALTLAAPGSWQAWNDLDAAMTGEVPHRRAWNTSRFDYLRDHPAEGRNFDLLMGQDPSDRHGTVADAYDFSRAASIVDVGGGNGALLRKILARATGSRGLVFDRADVVTAIVSDPSMGGRLTSTAGDFFEQVPGGADAYLLARVLHDWPDNDCLRILHNCRRAMRAPSRLLIIEQILEPDPAKGEALHYLSDMQMMAMFGSARERTQEEFAELLSASGFALTRRITTVSSASIIEAVLASDPTPEAGA